MKNNIASRTMKKALILGVLYSVATSLTTAQMASAEAKPVAIERAEGEQLSKAVAHFARSRALLVKALREFDLGLKLADPSALLNTEEWRSTLITRAEDLEKVLAPQPRASTTGGVQYEPDTRLLNEAIPK